MAEVKFSEFADAVSIGPTDAVVGLKNGANTKFPNGLFKGEKGDTGDTGATGSTGPEGPQGPQGLTGPAGADGATGPAGADGLDGAKGDTGDQGIQGIQGEIGPKGDQGDAGSGYVLIGDETVANLNALTAAAITTNDGYFMLDSGSVQPIGATSATGCVAGDLLVWAEEDAFINYGPQSGTVGPEGPTGPQGIQGIQGVEGPDGPQGDTGPQGIQGVTGATGAQGPVGPEGPSTPSTTAGNDLVLGGDNLLYYDAPEFTGVGTSGLVPSPAESDKILTSDGAWIDPPVSPVGGLSLNYLFSTTTVSANPGAGNIRLNNSDSTLATAMFVSSVSNLGNNLDTVWSNYRQGDSVGIWERATNRESDYFSITGPGVDNSGWWTFPVAWLSGTGGIENAAQVDLAPIQDSDERLPVGGTAGQALTKVSGTDYDTQWTTVAGAGGAVDSVFTRTGAVVAEAGDYAAFYASSAQGALADAALPADDYTAADVFAKVLTQDGPGSLLNADLLDGLDSTAFLQSADLANYVTGPASAVTGRIATYNGTTGKLIADGGKLAADLVTGPASSTNANLSSFNGTTGKLVADSGLAVSAVTAANALANTSVQPNDPISDLSNDAGYLTTTTGDARYYTETESDSLFATSAQGDTADAALPAASYQPYFSGTALPAVGGYSEGDLFMVYVP